MEMDDPHEDLCPSYGHDVNFRSKLLGSAWNEADGILPRPPEIFPPLDELEPLVFLDALDPLEFHESQGILNVN